jgi:hypothetical protein
LHKKFGDFCCVVVKINKLQLYTAPQINLTNVMWGKRSQTQKYIIILFHLYFKKQVKLNSRMDISSGKDQGKEISNTKVRRVISFVTGGREGMKGLLPENSV